MPAASCFNHSDQAAVGRCAQCGLPVCAECRKVLIGRDVCNQCVPAFQARHAADIAYYAEQAAIYAAAHPKQESSNIVATPGWTPVSADAPQPSSPGWTPADGGDSEQASIYAAEGQHNQPVVGARHSAPPVDYSNSFQPGIPGYFDTSALLLDTRLWYGVAGGLVVGCFVAFLWEKVAGYYWASRAFCAFVGYMTAWGLVRMSGERTKTAAKISAGLAVVTQVFGYILLTADQIAMQARLMAYLQKSLSLKYLPGLADGGQITLARVLSDTPGTIGIWGILCILIGCWVAYVTPTHWGDSRTWK